MRCKFLQNNFVLLIVFCMGLATAYLSLPLYRQALMWIYYKPYTQLVFKCDTAMRDHLLAKQRLARQSNLESVNVLEAAEIGLLDCQDYDEMRKRLIFLGLRENELALMGLEAIEEKASNLHRVVEIHEIRY